MLLLTIWIVMQTLWPAHIEGYKPKNVVRYQITLDIDPPCTGIQGQTEINYNVSGMLQALCQNHYNHQLKDAFKGLDRCKQRTRTRRSIGAIFASPVVSKIIDYIGTGVTNMITSSYSRTEDEEDSETIHQRLIDEVRETGRILLSDQMSMRQEVVSEVQAISKAALHHMNELKETAKDSIMLFWEFNLIEKKFQAGIANLRTIANHCSRGMMATEELAELVNSTDLAYIDPSTTAMVDFQLDVEEQVAVFTFDIIEGGTFSWIMLAGIVGTLLSVSYIG